MPEFDLGDINRAGGLPGVSRHCALPLGIERLQGCLSARENELFSLALSKETNVGAT